MLPTTSKGRSPSTSRQPNPVFPYYLRRIIKPQSCYGSGKLNVVGEICHVNMIDEGLPSNTNARCWQIVDYICRWLDSLSLHIVSNYLKGSPVLVYKVDGETKNQWARDDPAFVVICSLLLAVSTLAYCAAGDLGCPKRLWRWSDKSLCELSKQRLLDIIFGILGKMSKVLLTGGYRLYAPSGYDHSTGHAVYVVLSVLLFHFILTGVVLATSCWFLTNNYLREEAPNSYVVEQRVEWLYAFDVHCNSFFPMFVLLYVIHYFLSPLLLAHGFIPVLLSNLLFMVAVSYYHYLNFLGYDVLPFLERTTFFLYPIGLVIILSPICKYKILFFVSVVEFHFSITQFTAISSDVVIFGATVILSGFNPSRYVLSLYFSQRL
ncbi:hypothetical protein Cgig2_002867 [Carnegiea gigantea]|uniref:Uncharacterized protein n=1 Tax=Carnegiea gigantea TaxID=171969 RepID=A0A9Q1KN62_9CARY|nr:hypothetical protein Cgig2_002867 [Carnegiea gigantea]